MSLAQMGAVVSEAKKTNAAVKKRGTNQKQTHLSTC